MESPFTGLELKKELEGKRPVAVMIDGSLQAIPQAGIQDASMVFVCQIKRKFTRYMAIFLDKAPIKAGPMRSTRNYFVDWAMAYESFLAHCAGCPETIDRLSKEELIIDLDFVYLFDRKKNKREPVKPLKFFWLADDKIPPHNTYMNIKLFRETVNLEIIKKIKPEISFTRDCDVTDFAAYESVPHKNQKLQAESKASSVEINRGQNNKVLYEYIPSSNNYSRSIYPAGVKEPFYKTILKKTMYLMKNFLKIILKKNYNGLKNSSVGGIYKKALNSSVGAQKQIDENYNKPLEINNLILMWVKITPVTGSLRGRISVKTIDKGKAIFFMDGCLVNGTWLKICNDLAIRFFNDKGERVKFNPGNLWIEVLADYDKVKIA